MDELPTFPAAYWNPEESTSRVYYKAFNGEWRENGVPIDPSIIPLKGLKKLGNYYSSTYELNDVEEEKE